MKIKLIEHGPVGENGESYVYESEIDVGSEEEAYVKGREWQRLLVALMRGTAAEWKQQQEEAAAARAEADEPDAEK